MFQLIVDGDKVWVANFVEGAPDFTLSVSILGGPGRVVSVVPSAVIQRDTTDPMNSVCSAQFAPGTLVRLADDGIPGTFFGGWLSGCDTITLQGECEVTLDAETLVEAIYEPQAGAPRDASKQLTALSDCGCSPTGRSRSVFPGQEILH